jgi:hypothetical protein
VEGYCGPFFTTTPLVLVMAVAFVVAIVRGTIY